MKRRGTERCGFRNSTSPVYIDDFGPLFITTGRKIDALFEQRDAKSWGSGLGSILKLSTVHLCICRVSCLLLSYRLITPILYPL